MTDTSVRTRMFYYLANFMMDPRRTYYKSICFIILYVEMKYGEKRTVDMNLYLYKSNFVIPTLVTESLISMH